MADTKQKVTAGQRIQLLEKKEEFDKVIYKGKEGYIYIDFVQTTEDL